ncbi:MAG: caspase domain-containing protein [Alphaproteobacteria bacterium]
MWSWRFSVVLGAALLAALLAAGRSAAEASERRVALVIGNGQYVNVPRLANTANDARLIAETLERIGFSLVGGKALIDLDRAGIQKAIRSFGDQLNAAAVGLFYYAGHGLQIDGVNYLVPVDANPAKPSDVDFELVEADLVLKVMEGANSKLNLVILDACRNNPFGGRGLRDVGGGLAQMRAPRGTLISYATQPGNVASDGGPGSRDSPYALALAETLRVPGLELLETFNKVGVVVDRQTSGVQRPWVASSPIEGSFYFVPPGAPASAPAPAVPAAATPPAGADREIVFWQSIKDSRNPADFEAYLAQYPKGEFRGLAQNRLSELKTEQQAALAPRAPTPVASAAAPESQPAPASPTSGRFDGEWRGSVSAFGNNFSNNPCQNLEVTLKVVGNSVSGEIVGALGRSAVSGTIAADGTVKGTRGAEELSGRFQEDRFEGSLQGGDCRIGSISLKRSKS